MIQILREINLGKSRSSKTAVFAIFLALKMIRLVDFKLQKVQNHNDQNLEPLNL